MLLYHAIDMPKQAKTKQPPKAREALDEVVIDLRYGKEDERLPGVMPVPIRTIPQIEAVVTLKRRQILGILAKDWAARGLPPRKKGQRSVMLAKGTGDT